MSFGRLGIAHFPVLHRQLASPTNTRFSGSLTSQDDLTQDNKDVLIERLNDLVQRLSKHGASIEDNAVTNIHHMVDGIETLMREKPKEPLIEDTDSESEDGVTREQESLWGPPLPLTPVRNTRMRLPESWKSPQRSSPAPTIEETTVPKTADDQEEVEEIAMQVSQPSASTNKEMSAPKVAEIASEAEELAAQLSQTVAELQIRREESDHIHDLLVTRAEKAAERILLLEYRIAEMEDDFSSNQSELKFLRIQLQAIEAQTSQYIPLSADKDLANSITKWKFDWEEIDRKSRARRKKCHGSITNSDDSGTIVDSF
ncbi:hypothetical protein LSUE1_G005204 [Lachnellula suecica]|uniref:Uncharacterized protein n=1 Tax=Lachnellula suecica TaxID=602035 RepID=A0A8T9C0R6_9HELO|nr:hypothetical protein LSUE1_G005204 [Lachnellula suecica]